MVNFEQKFAFIIYLVSVIMSMTSKFNVLMWFGETKMLVFKIQKFPRKSGSKNSYSSHLGFQLSIPPNFVNVIAADLTVSKDIPGELHRFLSYVISSNPDTECEKTKRLILFIGQDLCHSLTNSEWKLPKHILLCMTIRHMCRSKQRTTLLNRLGNCESYEFGIELTPALAQALDESCTLFTPHILLEEKVAYCFILNGTTTIRSCQAYMVNHLSTQLLVLWSRKQNLTWIFQKFAHFQQLPKPRKGASNPQFSPIYPLSTSLNELDL